MKNTPNIVFIVADQFRGDCLGVEQSRHPVMTPHVDQISYEGVRFTRAYADCPICMPQRATMLTGQTASRFGLPRNFFEGTTRTPINSSISLPALLAREAGYQTKAVGKMHFNPQRARFGFEHVALHPDDYIMWLEDRGMGGLFRGHGLGGNEVYPTVSAVPSQFSHTRWITDEAIRFLYQRDPDCPFLLWMIFEAPHSPFDPPPPYDRMYANMPVPEPVMGAWSTGEEMPQEFRERRLANKFDRLRPAHILEARRRYYGQISEIDYNLGRVFGELKKRGLYESTLILFTSDHGEHLGDHGLFAKYSFLESSARVPFIWKFPKETAPSQGNRVLDTPVLTADIYPTILDMVGLIPPDDIDGLSLLPVLESPDVLDARIICGETDCSVFAANERFKYIYYPLGGVEQLFHVSNDPDDLHNLAGLSEHQKILSTLKYALISYLEQFNRPLVQDSKFMTKEREFDENTLRARNPMAWRGPLRYGEGY